jgi:hypothetical protein
LRWFTRNDRAAAARTGRGGSRPATALLLLATSCAGPPPTARRSQAPASWEEAAAGAPVARVDDVPIGSDCVATQMRTGRDRRQALEDCIGFELLAAEARRRGYLDHPDVRAARRRESVRALLHRDFEPGFDGPEDVPDTDIDRIWTARSVQSGYNHPEYRFTVHVNAPVSGGESGTERERAARALADEIHRALRDERDLRPADFLSRALAIAGARLLEAHPQVFNFPLRGRAVPPFADAAFAIPQVGSISAPVRTPWGWSIILLVKILPERHTSRAEAEPEIRQRIFTPARRRAFLRWYERLAAGHAIEIHPERLPAEKTGSAALALPAAPGR